MGELVGEAVGLDVGVNDGAIEGKALKHPGINEKVKTINNRLFFILRNYYKTTGCKKSVAHQFQ